MPRIPDWVTWQQAELLMQPALIRVVDNLRKHLENSPWSGTYEDIQVPYPGHGICLCREGQEVTLNLWHLCYQVCFLNYHPDLDEDGSQVVTIDLQLLDPEGTVNWLALEEKTQTLIGAIFRNLETRAEGGRD